ncbi:WxL domain-containing protein [Lactiplantibacillus plajomi]|uniref:WxL domain-containing protein n=1 Tax=Lactiplantibacillus plajomi TaxID=1457217 RepID=A0ABV6K5Z0_9LACO|nr:WxL domain-containing protein [Lactiplantibacillus plajomi]
MTKGIFRTGRLVLTTLALILIGTPVVSQAARRSQVQVNLTPTDDNTAVQPVDPDQPGQPYPGDSADPDNVTGTGSTDTLSIDYVSNLKFSATAANGPLELAARNQRAMIQITDRRGTGAGWTLQVTPSPLRSAQTTLSTTLTLGSIQLQAGSGNVSAAPQIVNTGPLMPGVANNVAVANANAGLGTWLFIFNRGATPTTLKINNRQLTTGNYTGTLAWSLTNAPH